MRDLVLVVSGSNVLYVRNHLHYYFGSRTNREEV